MDTSFVAGCARLHPRPVFRGRTTHCIRASCLDDASGARECVPESVLRNIYGQSGLGGMYGRFRVVEVSSAEGLRVADDSGEVGQATKGRRLTGAEVVEETLKGKKSSRRSN